MAVQCYTLEGIQEHKDSKNTTSCIIWPSWKNILDETLLREQAKIDATKNFEDVGYATNGRELLKIYITGKVQPDDRSNLAQPLETLITVVSEVRALTGRSHSPHPWS